MPTYRDSAIVLKTRSIRDADRHYTMFTRHHGKIVILAKGTRRGSSKMSPHLGTFGVVDIMVASGKIIDRLAGASLARPFKGLIGSFEKSSAAQGFLLLVDAMTKRELPEERIFDLLCEFLEAVERHEHPAASPTRPGASSGRNALFDAGAVKLLDILGFAPELDACVRCRGPLSPDGNSMNVMRGGVECATCADATSLPVSAGAIGTLQRLRAGTFAENMSARVSDAVRREVEFIADLFLVNHTEGRVAALRYLKAVA